MAPAGGSIDLIGSVALVKETQSQILLSDKIFRLHLSAEVDTRFFTHLMGSRYIRINVEQSISGAEGMANNITKTSVMGFRIALPSMDEQIKAVEYIERSLGRIAELIQRAKSAIELMQERRTALISAAVTGKIDVRNWEAPND